jgi:Ni/Co efflux regulator RcnB
MKRILTIAAMVVLLLPDIAAAQMGGPRPDRPGDNRPGRPGGDNRPGRPGDNRPGRPGDNRPVPGPGMRPPAMRPPAMRPPQRPPQWNWHGRYYDRMRGPAFRYPPGYTYRRWSIGGLLPGLFLSPAYYFDGWRGIGLAAPGPGRRWVRYGPDLLLVNTRTGRVIDVVYDAFY